MEGSIFKGAWLTVNRMCNFRCKWCYAEGTEYKHEDDMSFEMAKSLIDLASDLGVKTIGLIGGEPTYWKHLFQTIEYIHEKNLSSTIYTNGYLLSKDDFLDKVRASNLNAINISLKAANEEQHKELTGTYTFSDVLKGITEANKLEGKKVLISYVLNTLTKDNLKEVAKVLGTCGTKSMYLNMCVFIPSDGECNKEYVLEPNEFVRAIVDNIDEMCDIMGGEVSVMQNTMACIWPKDTLKRLIEEGKVIAGPCFVATQLGIVFTNEGEIIPCNHMYNYPFGKFGIHFNDAKSFLDFRNSDPVVEFYKKIRTYPKAGCADCSENTSCIGGCPLQWIAFDPNKIKNEYETC